MATETEKRIDIIVNDAALSGDAKIAKLRQLETDVLARQRATTEGMDVPGSRDGDDLKSIERALAKLGEAPVDPGPASL